MNWLKLTVKMRVSLYYQWHKNPKYLFVGNMSTKSTLIRQYLCAMKILTVLVYAVPTRSSHTTLSLQTKSCAPTSRHWSQDDDHVDVSLSSAFLTLRPTTLDILAYRPLWTWHSTWSGYSKTKCSLRVHEFFSGLQGNHRGSQLYFHITRYVLKRSYLAMWKYNCEPLWG
jgi:hypothetical protein